MKFIKPTVLTDAMLTSSTAPEPQVGYSAWNSGTTYNIGDLVVRTETHRIYEALTSNTNKTPETNTTDWLDIAPTNRWAMFDNVVGTQTSLTSPLTIVIEPGAVGGLALLELVGTSVSVSVKNTSGGSVIYSDTISLDGSFIYSFYDWFFEDYEQLTDVVLTDLPSSYADPEITISITSTGTVKCGVCKFGKVYDIGGTMFGALASIKDYSRKDTDAFGNITILQRSYVKRNEFKVELEPANFNKIYRTLATLRATPCVWIGVDYDGFLPFVIYGFYNDFSIDVAYNSLYYCSLEVEGLI